MDRKHRNSVLHDSPFGILERQFMVWPSIGVRVAPNKYTEAVRYLDNATDVFFDSEVIIIPKCDEKLINLVGTNFNANECWLASIDDEYKNGYGDKFATLAIQGNVRADLVVLGSSLHFHHEEVRRMISIAKKYPDNTLQSWKEVYLASMNNH
jgi:hypothetical protein